MKTILAVSIAALATIAAVTPADARDGCGRGFHRGPHGHCRADWRRHDGGPGPNALIVGNFYNGHGYWDGNRYWQRRERWNNSWRYR